LNKIKFGEQIISKKKYYYDVLKSRKPLQSTSRLTMTIIFGILIFVFIFFPLFGLNLRYQISGVLSILIDGIGSFCLIIGGLYMIVAVFGIFTKDNKWIKKVIIGATLLWVGCWCTGAVLDFFGILIGEATSSVGSGYH
jgi:hypothetical protein